MRKKWIATICMIILGGALLLQGCGKDTAADTPAEAPTELADSSAELTENTEADQTVEPVATPKATDSTEKTPVDGGNTTTLPESEPTPEPSTKPEDEPAPRPSAKPESEATPKPSAKPESKPTPKPTAKPESTPTPKPTAKPDNSAKSNLATPATAGALRVDGTQLVDCNGNAIQLKGLSTHGLAWFPGYINEECFKQFREEWNVNVIRLAMYTAEGGGYCTDGNKDDLKTLVKNGVEYATKYDMYVIIDWHILSDNNPNNYIEEAKKFFAEMSKEYAGYNNVLYEICNEPNGNTSWSDIKSYSEQVIEIIRANDEDGIILVGTPNWAQYVDQAAADPITGYDNIMYTLHFYAATHTDWLRDGMKAAINAGLPIFVSEYGICDASGNGAIDEYQANQWIKAMNDCGVSYVAWSISNKNETCAIFKSSCNKVSGFSEGDLSDSGKWVYQMLTGKSEVTLSGGGADGSPTGAGQNASSGNSGGNGGSSGNGGNAGDASGNGQNQNPGTPVGTEVTLTNNSLSVTAAIKNSWESEGKVFYQYDLTIENASGTGCDRWEIDLQFNGNITFSDGWNGDYTANGSTLHIACKDYNGSIAPGESVKEIGFILSGDKDLTIIE